MEASSPSAPTSPDAAATGARTFYRALHQAYTDTVLRLRPLPGSDLPAALMSQACGSFDGNLAAQCEGQPPVACHAGCAACCTLRVTASTPELLLIARFIRATAPALARAGVSLSDRVREADAHTRGLGEHARVHLRRRCAFLERGRCIVYPVRPLACRGHASHDARACAEAAAGRRQSVPFSGPHRTLRSLVQTSLLAALHDAGLDWSQAELNEGLVTLLDATDDTDQAWRNGGQPLGPAALPESRSAEAEALFAEMMQGGD